MWDHKLLAEIIEQEISSHGIDSVISWIYLTGYSYNVDIISMFSFGYLIFSVSI